MRDNATSGFWQHCLMIRNVFGPTLPSSAIAYRGCDVFLSCKILRPSYCLTRLFQLVVTSWMFVFVVSAIAVGADPKREFFEAKIRPVLFERCFECHSEQNGEREGGLSLDSREGLRVGGDSGPAIVAGDIDNSRLFAAITATEDFMPPDKRLSPEVIRDFRRWILDGAIDPRESTGTPTLHDPDYSEARTYWAFQPIKRPDVPSVSNRQWPRTRIDHFVLAKLEAGGLSPSHRASPEVLIRRLYFDLTGLPPSLEQLDSFRDAMVAGPRSQAIDVAEVDQLLDSPTIW